MTNFVPEKELRQFKSWAGATNFWIRKHTVDYNIVYSSAVEDEYNLKSWLFSDDDVIIDCGSMVGEECIPLGLAWPNTRIIVVEAIPENCIMIEENAQQNGVKNLTIINAALGSKTGKAKIRRASSFETNDNEKYYYFLGNVILLESSTSFEYITVPQLSLKKLFEEYDIAKCALLKMDIEGSCSLLSTCSISILRKIDWLIGEHHFYPRKKLLEFTKGVFEDIPCKWQTDSKMGHFRFRNKNLV